METNDDSNGNDNQSNLNNTTVHTFIMNKYKDIEGVRLFIYCCPVSLGKRELIVTQKHYYEARDLCSVMEYDMVKHVSFQAGNLIFDDYAELKEASDHYSDWEPYSISNDNEDEELDDVIKKKGKKRR